MKGTVAGYVVAVVTTAVALVLTAAFPEFLAPMRLFFLWCAVLITAFVSGVGPALLSIALCLAGAAYLVFTPFGWEPIEFARMAAFALFGGAISLAVASRKRAVETA